MAQQSTIYTIQASDAPQHTGKLREILQRMKAENRIGSVSAMNPDDDFASLPGTLKEEDMVLIVLTNELEGQKQHIEQQFKEMKTSLPGIRVAEILVDNVVYDNAFITFPGDLRCIRDREDMDTAWHKIEQDLKELFPVTEIVTPVAPSVDWPKYLKIAGIVAGVLLAIFLIKGLISGEKEKQPDSIYHEVSGTVIDAESNEPLPNVIIFVEEPEIRTVTDAEGYYIITNIEPGSYNLKASLAGYQQFETTFDFSEGGSLTVNPSMARDLEEERQRLEEEAARERELAEERQRQAEEAERQRQLEEERQRQAEEAERQRQLAEERQRQIEEARRQREEAAFREREDCLAFNSQNLQVQADGNRYLVTDGRSRMMTFRTRESAVQAVRIIRNYRLDNQCFAIRPNPGLRYFKVQGDIPAGGVAGEDCIRISDPQNLAIRESSPTLFQITDGRGTPYSAKSRGEAQRIVEIVRHYNARFTCYVERPNPGMVYLRK